MRRLVYGLAIGAAAILAPATALAASPYPEPAPLLDESRLGEKIQRTMTLLATSTAQRRNRVRILFYGQSITAQGWTRLVEEDLRRRFPFADLQVENRAIGGFASQLLSRTAEYDLYPFYPDLLIFHVYGSHTHYEEIIRNARTRTTAEILMQSDHITKWPEPVKGQNPWQWPWEENMNRNLLPAIAAKYGCAFVNIRGEWLQYLKDNGYQPRDLLSDDVHLNRHGEFLMARLVSRYLRHNPALGDESMKDAVRTFAVGRDIRWSSGRLELEFDGNRVDAVFAPGPAGSAAVLVDGRKPSEFPELYYHSRPSGTPGVGWPAIKRIGWEKPLVLETWTAVLTGFNDEQTRFAFTVTGSATGPDGAGTAEARFVSNSGRVVIEPGDWVFEYCRKVSGKRAPEGFKVTWKVVPTFVDRFDSPRVEDPSREYAVTLVQGLANGRHRLELVADGGRLPPLAAMRVYRPPLK